MIFYLYYKIYILPKMGHDKFKSETVGKTKLIRWISYFYKILNL